MNYVAHRIRHHLNKAIALKPSEKRTELDQMEDETGIIEAMLNLTGEGSVAEGDESRKQNYNLSVEPKRSENT